MAKSKYSDEEMKILKSGIGTILWKIIFWPVFAFWALIVIALLTDVGNNIFGIIFISIPMGVITYFAFRKQWFWREDKQRAYIAKVQSRRNKKAKGTYSEPVYKATPYAMKPGELKHEERSIQPQIASDVKVGSIDNLVVSEIPPLQGNYAKAVFLWAFRKPSPIKKNGEYAAYFLYECGIRDCVEYHKNLINAGYFIEATPAEKLESLKVPELKKILEEMKQPVSGKKADLIDRIIGNAEPEYLEKKNSQKLYKLSELGTEFLNQYNAYAEIHRHKNWGISWVEYDSYAKPNEPFLTVMWRILNVHLEKASLQEQRNVYLTMYQILSERGNKSDALEMLLKVLYLDFSGIEGQNVYDLYKQGIYNKKQTMDCFSVSIMLAPGLLNALEEFKDVYDTDMVDELYTWQLPVNICPKELFKEILDAGINGQFDEEKYAKKLKAHYNKMVETL